MTNALLLDTNAAIWFADGTIDENALSQIMLAGLAGIAFVSPITAWEVGLLAQTGRATNNGVNLLPNAGQWYSDLLAQPLLTETALTAEILIASTQLPGNLHKDPADRMFIATAHVLGCPLMTSDSKIARYARQGHIQVIRCKRCQNP